MPLDTTTPTQSPTIQQVVEEYLASTAFTKLAESSRYAYELCLRQWLRVCGCGDQLIATLTTPQLEAQLERQSKGSANYLFKRLRVLVKFAIVRGYMGRDSTRGIKCPPIGKRHHTWTEDEIAQYRKRWRIGTRQRLCLELALNTSQRRADLSRMRWEHIQDGLLYVDRPCYYRRSGMSLDTAPRLGVG